MLKPENFFAIDLELNEAKDDISPRRIIQVGVAIGNITEPDDIKTFSWYMNRYQKVTPFITQLTGITTELLQEKAVKHEVVAQELGELLKVYNCFCNPIVWGGSPKFSDAEELKAEFRERNIDFPFFGNRVIDVKTIFTFNQIIKQRTKKSGLSKAMASYGLKFDGKQHDASDDAKNTLRFFFHLLYRQKTFEDFKASMEIMK